MTAVSIAHPRSLLLPRIDVVGAIEALEELVAPSFWEAAAWLELGTMIGILITQI